MLPTKVLLTNEVTENTEDNLGDSSWEVGECCRYRVGNAEVLLGKANGDVGAPERFEAGQAWLQGDSAFLPFQTKRPAAWARLA